MVRSALSAALVLLLAGCGADGARGGGDGAPARAGAATLPPAPPADTPPETRFPLAYPHLTIPTYAVEQSVEILHMGTWVPATVREVRRVDGEQVVRTTWPNSDLPNLIMNEEQELRLPTGRLGADLAIGRYVCRDGGTDRPDLDFRVADWGRYTDPFGEDAGTFTTSGDTITFTGGRFDGLTAQQLANSAFYFTPQAMCRWKAEGL